MICQQHHHHHLHVSLCFLLHISCLMYLSLSRHTLSSLRLSLLYTSRHVVKI